MSAHPTEVMLSDDVLLTVECFGYKAVDSGLSKDLKDRMYQYYIKKMLDYRDRFLEWLQEPSLNEYAVSFDPEYIVQQTVMEVLRRLISEGRYSQSIYNYLIQYSRIKRLRARQIQDYPDYDKCVNEFDVLLNHFLQEMNKLKMLKGDNNKLNGNSRMTNRINTLIDGLNLEPNYPDLNMNDIQLTQEEEIVKQNSWDINTRLYMIKDSAKVYTDTFATNLEQFQHRYANTGEIDVKLVISSIAYILEVRCGKVIPTNENIIYLNQETIEDLRRYDQFVFPLLIESGQFTLWEYIYALSNQVVLVGMPPVDAEADGLLYCPYGFYHHDVAHNALMLPSIYNKLTSLHDVYDELVTLRPNPERELILNYYWYMLHEIGILPYFDEAQEICEEAFLRYIVDDNNAPPPFPSVGLNIRDIYQHCVQHTDILEDYPEYKLQNYLEGYTVMNNPNLKHEIRDNYGKVLAILFIYYTTDMILKLPTFSNARNGLVFEIENQ